MTDRRTRSGERLITYAEAAALPGAPDRTTIARWRASGRLKPFDRRDGKVRPVLFREPDVLREIERMRARPQYQAQCMSGGAP